MNKLLLLFVIIGAVSCQEEPQITADLIIENAKIYTVDDQFSMATTLAVKEGNISFIGTQEELKRQNLKASKNIDATGKIV